MFKLYIIIIGRQVYIVRNPYNAKFARGDNRELGPKMQNILNGAKVKELYRKDDKVKVTICATSVASKLASLMNSPSKTTFWIPRRDLQEKGNTI